jgi:hypothetical protein
MQLTPKPQHPILVDHITLQKRPAPLQQPGKVQDRGEETHTFGLPPLSLTVKLFLQNPRRFRVGGIPKSPDRPSPGFPRTSQPRPVTERVGLTLGLIEPTMVRMLPAHLAGIARLTPLRPPIVRQTIRYHPASHPILHHSLDHCSSSCAR